MPTIVWLQDHASITGATHVEATTTAPPETWHVTLVGTDTSSCATAALCTYLPTESSTEVNHRHLQYKSFNPVLMGPDRLQIIKQYII